MRRKLATALLIVSALLCTGAGPTDLEHTTTLYMRGLLRKPNAPTARDYLGIQYVAGLTTNISLVFGNGTTNTLSFSNGILVAIVPSALHSSSLILPGGGYILQPNGGTFLLP